MEKIKSMSKSADVIHCISFRSDGKLFALGNSAGNIQVFDSSSKKLIRNLKGHKGPVRKVLFSPDKQHLFSISDDKTFKVWNIPAESETTSIVAHDDYVRACAISLNGKYFVTGSYDHTIKIWSTEDFSQTMILVNDCPIEDVLISPSGSVIISCGGNTIKFWDLTSGGKLIYSMSPHQKTITSLVYSSDYNYLVSAGLDRISKIIDLSSYRVVHGFKFDSPVMSVACNSSDSALGFGLANGSCMIKTRKIPVIQPLVDVSNSVNFEFISSRKQKQFTNYEKAFKAFKFRDAIDECIREGNPRLILACFTELIAYDTLSIALSGRDEMRLLPVLRFVSKSIQNPEFSFISLNVLSKILDIYGENIGQSSEIDECLTIIFRKMESELLVTNELTKIGGQLDMISSSLSRSSF